MIYLFISIKLCDYTVSKKINSFSHSLIVLPVTFIIKVVLYPQKTIAVICNEQKGISLKIIMALFLQVNRTYRFVHLHQ